MTPPPWEHPLSLPLGLHNRAGSDTRQQAPFSTIIKLLYISKTTISIMHAESPLTPEALGSLVRELSHLNGFLAELIELQKGQLSAGDTETRHVHQKTDMETAQVPGQMILNRESLQELQEKFLSVFDVASILQGKELPWYHVSRDIVNLGPSRAPDGPIPGNDFHTMPRISAEPLAWSANLQFDSDHRMTITGPHASDPLLVPLAHFQHHSKLGNDATDKIEEAAVLIRALWPDDVTGQPKRRVLGPPLTDPMAPEYHVFYWLASKDVNTEVFGARLIARQSGGRFVESPLMKPVSRTPTHHPVLSS